MFNGFNEPSLISYNEFPEDREKKQNNVSKWVYGHDSEIQPAQLHPVSRHADFWSSKGSFLGNTNFVNFSAKCTCSGCFSSTGSHSYQDDSTRHRPWLPRSFPVSVSGTSAPSKLPGFHQWENFGVGGQQGCGFVTDGGQYLGEPGEAKRSYFRHYQDSRVSEENQLGVITSVKNSDLIKKQKDELLTPGQEMGFHEQNVSRQPILANSAYILPKNMEKRNSSYCDLNEKYSNLDSYRHPVNYSWEHHMSRLPVVEPHIRAVPSNLNHNRVPSTRHRTFNENTPQPHIEEAYSSRKDICLETSNGEKTSRMTCPTMVAKDETVSVENFPAQQANNLSSAIDLKNGGVVDHRHFNMSISCGSVHDQEPQKLYDNTRHPDYFQRGVVLDAVIKHNQTSVLDTRKDCQVSEQRYANVTKSNQTAKTFEYDSPKNFFGPFYSRDKTSKSDNVEHLQQGPLNFQRSENNKNESINAHGRLPRSGLIFNDARFVDRPQTSLHYQNNPPSYRNYTRSDCPYQGLSAQDHHDYSTVNFQRNDWNQLAHRDVQQQLPACGVDQFMPQGNSFIFNSHQQSSGANPEKTVPQPLYPNKHYLASCVPVGSPLLDPKESEPLVSRKPAYLETIRSDELNRSGNSKISPLRLLRKKKLMNLNAPEPAPAINTNDSTPALDVRKFWSTWAEEEEENVPSTHVVVLDCQNIDPEQAKLLNLYESDPAESANLDGSDILPLKEVNCAKEPSQNFSLSSEEVNTFNNDLTLINKTESKKLTHEGEEIVEKKEDDLYEESQRSSTLACGHSENSPKITESGMRLDSQYTSTKEKINNKPCKRGRSSASLESKEPNRHKKLNLENQTDEMVRLDKWTEKKFDFLKRAEESRAAEILRHEEEKKKILERRLSFQTATEVKKPICSTSSSSSEVANTKAETSNKSNTVVIDQDLPKRLSPIENRSCSISPDVDNVESPELPTCEYRKNKFLDYSDNKAVAVTCRNKSGSGDHKETPEDLSSLLNVTCSGILDDASASEVAEIKNESIKPEILDKTEEPPLGKGGFNSLPSPSRINCLQLKEETGLEGVEMDDILRKISEINFQNPKGKDLKFNPKPSCSKKVKIGGKKKKKKKKIEVEGESEKLTVENISVSKPTIKFSIQKSHDLKISFRVLNGGTKKYEKNEERESMTAEGEDSSLDNINSSTELITLRLKSIQRDSLTQDKRSKKALGGDEVLEESKGRTKKKKKRKTNETRFQRQRFTLVEDEEKDPLAQETDTENVEDHKPNGLPNDFQVQETVDSAKIKLTFKRHRTSRPDEKTGCSEEASEAEPLEGPRVPTPLPTEPSGETEEMDGILGTETAREDIPGEETLRLDRSFDENRAFCDNLEESAAVSSHSHGTRRDKSFFLGPNKQEVLTGEENLIENIAFVRDVNLTSYETSNGKLESRLLEKEMVKNEEMKNDNFCFNENEKHLIDQTAVEQENSNSSFKQGEFNYGSSEIVLDCNKNLSSKYTGEFSCKKAPSPTKTANNISSPEMIQESKTEPSTLKTEKQDNFGSREFDDFAYIESSYCLKSDSRVVNSFCSPDKENEDFESFKKNLQMSNDLYADTSDDRVLDTPLSSEKNQNNSRHCSLDCGLDPFSQNKQTNEETDHKGGNGDVISDQDEKSLTLLGPTEETAKSDRLVVERPQSTEEIALTTDNEFSTETLGPNHFESSKLDENEKFYSLEDHSLNEEVASSQTFYSKETENGPVISELMAQPVLISSVVEETIENTTKYERSSSVNLLGGGKNTRATLPENSQELEHERSQEQKAATTFDVHRESDVEEGEIVDDDDDDDGGGGGGGDKNEDNVKESLIFSQTCLENKEAGLKSSRSETGVVRIPTKDQVVNDSGEKENECETRKKICLKEVKKLFLKKLKESRVISRRHSLESEKLRNELASELQRQHYRSEVLPHSRLKLNSNLKAKSCPPALTYSEQGLPLLNISVEDIPLPFGDPLPENIFNFDKYLKVENAERETKSEEAKIFDVKPKYVVSDGSSSQSGKLAGTSPLQDLTVASDTFSGKCCFPQLECDKDNLSKPENGLPLLPKDFKIKFSLSKRKRLRPIALEDKSNHLIWEKSTDDENLRSGSLSDSLPTYRHSVLTKTESKYANINSDLKNTKNPIHNKSSPNESDIVEKSSKQPDLNGANLLECENDIVDGKVVQRNERIVERFLDERKREDTECECNDKDKELVTEINGVVDIVQKEMKLIELETIEVMNDESLAAMDLENSENVRDDFYACEDIPTSEDLPHEDGDIEEEKVLYDDKFRNIMQNCLDNAKRFLNVGNLKLFSCSVDDLLGLDCPLAGPNSADQELAQTHVNHFSRDVLLTSCEEAVGDDLGLSERFHPSELSMDFVPSFSSDGQHNLCSEILPVDNWPYLEEEVPSSPGKMKVEESDLMHSLEDNDKATSQGLDIPKENRNYHVSSSVSGQKSPLSGVWAEADNPANDEKPKRVFLTDIDSGNFQRFRRKSLFSRKTTGSEKFLEGSGFRLQRRKTVGSFSSNLLLCRKSSEKVFHDLKNEISEIKNGMVEKMNKPLLNENGFKCRLSLDKLSTKTESENSKSSVNFLNSKPKGPFKAKPASKKLMDYKSAVWQPKVVLIRISKNEFKKSYKNSCEENNLKSQNECKKDLPSKVSESVVLRETEKDTKPASKNQSSSSSTGSLSDSRNHKSKPNAKIGRSTGDCYVDYVEKFSVESLPKPKMDNTRQSSFEELNAGRKASHRCLSETKVSRKPRFRNLHSKRKSESERFCTIRDIDALSSKNELVVAELILNERLKDYDKPKECDLISNTKSTKEIWRDEEKEVKSQSSKKLCTFQTGKNVTSRGSPKRSAKTLDDAKKLSRGEKVTCHRKSKHVTKHRHGCDKEAGEKYRISFEHEREKTVAESDHRHRDKRKEGEKKKRHGSKNEAKERSLSKEKQKCLESSKKVAESTYSFGGDAEETLEHSVDEEPWVCDVCGFSKNSERILHIKTHPFHCQSCHLAFKTESHFVQHLTKKHKDIRNQHHCLLCELSFDTEQQYQRHLETREHRHLESVEKNTINTLFTLLTGQPCPVLGLVEMKPEWLPSQAGTVHFYHQATPLSLALQYLKMQYSTPSSARAD